MINNVFELIVLRNKFLVAGPAGAGHSEGFAQFVSPAAELVPG